MANVLADLFVDIKANNNPLQSGLSQAKGMLAGFGGAVAGVAAAAGAALVAGFAIKEMISSFAEGEVAANQLSAAFKAAGADVDTGMASFERFSQEMMQLTTVGDEAVAEMYRLGLQMGVPAEGLENMTKAAVGLGRAFNMDSATAIKAIAQETQGVQSGALEKMIPALKGVNDQTERLNIIRKAANAGLEQEQAYTQTLSGMWAMLQNALGEVAETLGGFLAPALKTGIELMQGVVQWVADLITKLQEATYETSNMSGFWNLLTDGFSSSGEVFTAVADGIVAGIQWIVGAVDTLFGWINETMFLFQNWDLVAESTGIAIVESVVNMWERFKWFFENLKVGLAWVGDNFVDLWMNAFEATTTVLINFGQNVRDFFSALWDYIKSGGQDGFNFVATGLTEGMNLKDMAGPEWAEFVPTDLFDEQKADLQNRWVSAREDFEKTLKTKKPDTTVKPKVKVDTIQQTAHIEEDKKKQEALQKEDELRRKWATEDAMNAEKNRLDKEKDAKARALEGVGSFQGLGDAFKNATKSLADKEKRKVEEEHKKIAEQQLQAMERQYALLDMRLKTGLA